MGRPVRNRRGLNNTHVKFTVADVQLNWPSMIQTLAVDKHTVVSTEFLSIHGEAPKDFVRTKEFTPGVPHNRKKRWTSYIAKIGSKYYPLESITEHVLTRIGQLLGVAITPSRLCIVQKQVRFLSRYFLASNESLVHGIEIF